MKTSFLFVVSLLFLGACSRSSDLATIESHLENLVERDRKLDEAIVAAESIPNFTLDQDELVKYNLRTGEAWHLTDGIWQTIGEGSAVSPSEYNFTYYYDENDAITLVRIDMTSGDSWKSVGFDDWQIIPDE
ncbi:uncharacterized protein XM38_009260 [Halomicronema hongdechloris C2206]|uniref:Lipoprotein n=1 Tax=Halomicronema hongdechloris C2206 TaxID=1641165 RepID=A0A1Z3HI76_9CYAN|nr:hypothetical protein [Halomicronema hongdechloris]ASC69996.1 uncharacterized protein XM38_009260 [Halomicronema hongdechloris C2206]